MFCQPREVSVCESDGSHKTNTSSAEVTDSLSGVTFAPAPQRGGNITWFGNRTVQDRLCPGPETGQPEELKISVLLHLHISDSKTAYVVLHDCFVFLFKT